MTGRAWLIKDLLWKRTLFLWDQAGNSKQAAVPSVPQDCGKWALGTSLELLFQGGFLQVPLICTPPRRCSPSCFPQSPGTVEYGLTPGDRSGTLIPGWQPLVPLDLYSSPEGPSCFPQPPQDCGIWASRLEAGLEL